MYLVNLIPLEHIWRLLIVMVAAAIVLYLWLARHDRRPPRSIRDREKRYWHEERKWRRRNDGHHEATPELNGQHNRRD